jgi:tRNA-splicing ligase RtcB
MSRSAAIRKLSIDNVMEQMQSNDIYLRNGSKEGVLEEAPDAYKNVDQVIEVVCNAGLTAKVAKLTPIGVIKG